MSKSDTSAPVSGLNRRGLLRGAGGIAAAGALAALPLSPDAAAAAPSAQLLEYRRCKAAWLECFVEPYEEDEAWEARVAQTSGAVEEAIEAFLERAYAPRSWADVSEIAEVWRTEMFDVDEDGELDKHSDHEEIDTMLLRAALVMGGYRIEPEPGPEVPAGSVIRLPNRPYAAERRGYWTDYDIVFVGHLIGHFRDTAKAATYFDVPEAAIMGWIRTDYIPPAWHPKVYALLEETGQTIAPHILGLAEDDQPVPTRLVNSARKGGSDA